MIVNIQFYKLKKCSNLWFLFTWIAEIYTVLWWRWKSHLLHSDPCSHNFGHILRYGWWATSYLCLWSSHSPNNKTVVPTSVYPSLSRVLSEPYCLFEIATNKVHYPLAQNFLIHSIWRTRASHLCHTNPTGYICYTGFVINLHCPNKPIVCL